MSEDEHHFQTKKQLLAAGIKACCSCGWEGNWWHDTPSDIAHIKAYQEWVDHASSS